MAERSVPLVPRRVARGLAGWSRCKRGVSAVEFALIAPALAFSLISTVDLGLGMAERMAIDHTLRSGAQRAIDDPGTTEVTQLMNTAAGMNFGPGGPTPLSVSTNKFCACPENVTASVACTTVCAGAKPTFVYYRMTAQKTYKGWLLPPMTFNRSVQVQIR